jgi:hypothetical protein
MEKINSAIQSFIQRTGPPATGRNTDLNGDPRESSTQAQPEEQDAPERPPAELNQAVGLWQTPPLVPIDTQAADTAIGQTQPIDITGVPEASSRLPPAPLLTKLINFYFDLVYAWCPLFHKQTFIQEMHDEGRQILLHGIVVVCFRFCHQWNAADPDVGEQDR